MGSERREITAGVGYRVGVRPGIGFRREEGQVQIQLGYQTDLAGTQGMPAGVGLG